MFEGLFDVVLCIALRSHEVLEILDLGLGFPVFSSNWTSFMHIFHKLSASSLHFPPIENISSPFCTELIVYSSQFTVSFIIIYTIFSVALEFLFEIL